MLACILTDFCFYLRLGWVPKLPQNLSRPVPFPPPLRLDGPRPSGVSVDPTPTSVNRSQISHDHRTPLSRPLEIGLH